MPGSPARSQTVDDEAFAVPVRRRRPPPRTRRRRRRVPLHLGLEAIFGAALAVVPALLGLPPGMAALAAIMGALIAVTAVSAPRRDCRFAGVGCTTGWGSTRCSSAWRRCCGSSAWRAGASSPRRPACMLR